MNSRTFTSLLFPIAAFLTGLLVAASAGLLPLHVERSVLGLLTGFAVMWFLDLGWSLYLTIRPSKSARLLLSVNRDMLASEVAVLEKQLLGDAAHDYIPSRRLLGADPVLALAQVRIQLERSLRHLAESSGILVTDSGSIRRLVESLLVLEKIPPVMVGLLNEVVDVCNKAVHGYSVDRQTAEVVVETGEKLVNVLDNLPFAKGHANRGPA